MKTIQIENIGEVLIKKNNRAKYIRISVNPYEPITLTVPVRVSIKDSIAVLKAKEDWIIRQLRKNTGKQPQEQILSDQIAIKTLKHNLHIKKGPVKFCTVHKHKEEVTIMYPPEFAINSIEVQEFIRSTVSRIIRREAREYLPLRTAVLAEKHKFDYEKIFIKNSKTRWGSCSAVNNINLNLHLVLLPPHLCDYVILHELVHTVEKNHGKQFWARLNDIAGDAKKLRRELHSYTHFLYQVYR